MYQKIICDLNKFKNPNQAKNLQRFFKTGKGEYGQGDVFLGLKMAQTRYVAKKYFYEASLDDVQKLLDSKIHEYRMVGVLILVSKFRSAGKEMLRDPSAPPSRILRGGVARDDKQKDIYNFYLKNSKRINNWDLVDLSAPNIVGAWLLNVETPRRGVSTKLKSRKVLYKLARSKNLWQRRIAVLSTFAFIKNNKFKDAIKISEILLNDKHDLIHKAVGWMLREIGKRNQKVLLKFLDKHSRNMPRVMLRYAIERLGEKKRKYYLSNL